MTQEGPSICNTRAHPFRPDSCARCIREAKRPPFKVKTPIANLGDWQWEHSYQPTFRRSALIFRTFEFLLKLPNFPLNAALSGFYAALAL